MSGGNCWNLRVTAEVNQGGRKYMEDVTSVQFERVKSGKIIVEYAAFAIYDGHGGKDAAYFARDHLLENIKLQRGFFSNDVETIKKSISDAFVATHMQMWNKLPEWPKTSLGHPSTAGTTASLVIIRGNRMFVANVGDSMIVMGSRDIPEKLNSNSNFVAKDLTIDHKPELLKERKRIEKSGGCVMNKSGVNRVVWSRPKITHTGPIRRSTKLDKIPFLAVARSLGDLWSFNSELNEFVVSPVPDVYVYDLHKTKEQFIILASDGLWNMIRPQEAVTIVGDVESKKNKQVKELNTGQSPAHQLVQLALDRWKMRMMRADNTSVIVVIIERRKLNTAKSSETYLESWTSAKVEGEGPDTTAPGEFHALHSKRRSNELPTSPSSAPELSRENTDIAGPSKPFEPLQDSSISSSSGDVTDDIYPLLRSNSKRVSVDEEQPTSSGIKSPMLTRSQTRLSTSQKTKRKRSAGDTPSSKAKTRRKSAPLIPKSSSKFDVGVKTRSSTGGMALRKRPKKSI